MTQSIPADLTFEDLSPVYGANYLAWIGLRPSTTVGNYTAGGNLCDAYATIFGASAASVVDGATSSLTNTYAFMIREFVQADQGVAAAFNMLPISGSAGNGDFVEWSVMGRIQAGSIAGDGTRDVRYEDVTCYQFRAYKNGSNVSFDIRKFVTGSVSTLGSVLSFPGSLVGPLMSQRILVLALNITGSAPVSISTALQLIDPNTGLAIDTFPLHIGVTDASSPITGTGRVGFSMGKPRNGAEADVADVCAFHQIDDADSPAIVLLRDEFTRALKFSLDTTETDVLGNSGKYLQGAFNRDQFAFTGSGGAVLLARDVGNDRVKVDLNTVSTEAALILAHRPATDVQTHHRSTVINLANASHDEIGGGIVLFASQAEATSSTTGESGFTDATGYAVLCKHTTAGPVFSIALWRFDGSGATLIAEKTGAAAIFAIGSNFTLDFDIFPQDGAGGFPTAPVLMIVEVDAVQVVLTAIAGVTGISASAAGTVTDNSTDKITNGASEGFIAVGTNLTDLITFDTWTEQMFHVPSVPENDIPTVAVLGEGASSGNDIKDTLEQDFDVSVDDRAPSITIPFESGDEYTAARHTDSSALLKPRRVWTFQRGTSTKAQHQAMETFFNDHDGIEDNFDYTDPDDVLQKVHFVKGSLRRTQRAHGTYGTRFELEEAF